VVAVMMGGTMLHSIQRHRPLVVGVVGVVGAVAATWVGGEVAVIATAAATVAGAAPVEVVRGREGLEDTEAHLPPGWETVVVGMA